MKERLIQKNSKVTKGTITKILKAMILPKTLLTRDRPLRDESLTDMTTGKIIGRITDKNIDMITGKTTGTTIVLLSEIFSRSRINLITREWIPLR